LIVSPYFFTHYPPNSFDKNWLFYSDWLWQPRWEQILQLRPSFVQVITWNGTLLVPFLPAYANSYSADYGESHCEQDLLTIRQRWTIG